MSNRFLLAFAAGAMLLCASSSDVIFHEDFKGPVADGIPTGWQFWSPSANMKLQVAAKPGAFRMDGAGNPQAKGRITKMLTGFQGGEWYRFAARYRTTGVMNPANAVLAIAEMSGSQQLRVLNPESTGGPEITTSIVFQYPAKVESWVKFHLFAGFLPNGSVEWLDATVTKVSGYEQPKQPVRLVVIDSRPPKPGPAIESAKHYVAEIDRACAGKQTDVVLLPENFNKANVVPQAPVAMDSPYMKLIRDAARRHNTYIAGSLFEDRDGYPFNSGFLIDRKGALVGSYRKTHLTIGEMVFSTIGRGDEMPVFDTDIGKIAVAICFDFHYPEVGRLLALKGAKLVLVPMAADDRLRENGISTSAEHVGKAFVVENHVPIAFAATLGRTKQPSLIIDQHGETLARSSDDVHTIAAALDLKAPALRWSGEEWLTKYRVGRRPELYNELGLK